MLPGGLQKQVVEGCRRLFGSSEGCITWCTIVVLAICPVVYNHHKAESWLSIQPGPQSLPCARTGKIRKMTVKQACPSPSFLLQSANNHVMLHV